MAGRQKVAYANKGRSSVLRALQQKSSASSRIERARKVAWWRALQPPLLVQIITGLLPKSPPRGWVAPAGWPP